MGQTVQVKGGGLTSIPEQAEAQAGCEQQEETSMTQAQPWACVDLGERYAHPIHRHCPAYGGREAFRACLGVEVLPDAQEAFFSLPSNLPFASLAMGPWASHSIALDLNCLEPFQNYDSQARGKRRGTSPAALMVSSGESQAVVTRARPSLAVPPFSVTVTSEHVHNGALQLHGQRLGAGEATGPTGQVLGRDCELAAGLSHQQIFTGSREGESQPIECHIVGGP